MPNNTGVKLRLTASIVGLVGALFLARMIVRLSAGDMGVAPPVSILDRLILWVEPIFAGLALLACIGLWNRQRWGAIAFTTWLVIAAGQVAMLALLVIVLAGFMWQPLLVWGGIMAGVLFVAFVWNRSVWRWLSPVA